MKFFFILLFLLQNAFAGECAPLNLITEPNSPFRQIPVYNQGGTGLCYAYAAAPLIDYHVIKNGGTRSIHPLWAAMAMAERYLMKSLEGGKSFFAIEEIRMKGNCHTSIVNQSLKDIIRKANATEIDIVAVMNNFAAKLEHMNAKKLKEGKKDGLTSIEIQEAWSKSVEEQKLYCPHCTWDEVFPEFKAISHMNAREMFGTLILPACKSQKKLLSLPTTMFELIPKEEAFAPLLDTKLKVLKAPVNILYCANVFFNPTFTGVKTSSGYLQPNKDCIPHESMIVGKKTINGSCHFLLRNSWGAGFAEWTEKFKCVCRKKHTNEYVDDCTNKTHNNGEYVVEGCWHSEETLSKNSWGATYLTK